MGSGGSGTGGGATNIGGEKPIKAVGKPSAKKPPSARTGLGIPPGQSQAMFGTSVYGGLRVAEPTAPPRETLVSDFSTPTDSLTRTRGSVRDVSELTPEERGMRQRTRLAPGDVLATIGTSGYGQVASAKLAGRTDVSKEQLGDLATRTNIGQLPEGRVSIPGVGTAALNILNVIGKASAKTILDRIIEGDEPITNPSGRVVGARGESGTFSVAAPAAPSVSPTGRDDPQMSDITPEVTPEVTPERDDVPLATRGRTAFTRDRRRTRAARFGQAGLGEEGILLRGASSSYGG